MKNIKLSFVSFLFVFVVIGFVGVSDVFANVFIVSMTSAEKTGSIRKVYHDRGFWVREYEIEIEWEYNLSCSPLDLYRKSSPGAYPNGTKISDNVEPYYEEWIYYPIPGVWMCKGYYRDYDWAQSGTWYYMAEQAINEVNETVP
ncbi:hypothetical protein H8E88_13905 [candidate division KSB1 bacterium]|nr:hypothetical protein [candidate division KSB1 bacterium]MBL7093803.1 hypothetical protein [candidate division KSB1 bacterium]